MKIVPSANSVISMAEVEAQLPALPDAVSAGTRAALAAANIVALTPVQKDAIPHALLGADVLAKGKTGTGKTLAFLVPTVERLLTGAHRVDVGGGAVRSLILTSARELATQIATEAERLLSYQKTAGAAPLKVVTVVGGRGIGADLSALASGADLLVATPGRLGEHVEKTDGFVARLGGVETVVLDEADQLVEGGFLKLVESLLRTLPPTRQTLCFSATLPLPLMEVSRLRPVLTARPPPHAGALRCTPAPAALAARLRPCTLCLFGGDRRDGSAEHELAPPLSSPVTLRHTRCYAATCKQTTCWSAWTRAARRPPQQARPTRPTAKRRRRRPSCRWRTLSRR